MLILGRFELSFARSKEEALVSLIITPQLWKFSSSELRNPDNVLDFTNVLAFFRQAGAWA